LCVCADYYLPLWFAAFSVVWDFLSGIYFTNRNSQVLTLAELIVLVLSKLTNFILIPAVYLVGRFILAPIGIFGFLIHKYMTTKKASGNEEIFLVNQQHLMPKRYTFSDIIAITNNFKDKLGQGGFGNVYKGQLRDAFLVAVKMLGNAKCNDEDFINEVSIIGRIHHVNIVRLVGFCSEGSYRALVFEYMANGSLDKLLFSRETELLLVSWEKLLQIAVGTARGIEHLHGGCSVCILHLDIKPHNVLLEITI
jgi:hypothetical protein